MSERTIVVPFIAGFGGVERLVLGLSRFLHEERVPHRLVCLQDTVGMASRATWDLPVTVLPARRSPPAEAIALRSYLATRASRADFPPLLFDLKGAFYARFLRRPYVLHLTDPPSLLAADVSKHATGAHGATLALRLRGKAVHGINRGGVRRASRVVVMTRQVADETRSLYGVEPVVIRPGVRSDPGPLPTLESGDGVYRLLSVSRLERSKRVDWIMRALQTLSRDEPERWRLDVVGEGPERLPLESLASQLGISDRVTFHGAVDDRTLDLLFAAASVFVMPARQGYGLPALESLQRGRPVVLHGDSGVSEVLTGSPWVISVTDPGGADLAGALRVMRSRAADGTLTGSPAPVFPSERSWAEAMARCCGWL